jgi:hypothetical protein
MTKSILWLSSLCALTLWCTETEPFVSGPQQPEKPLEQTYRPMAFSARYTSPRGIGYSPGYTTLEGFFSWMFHDKYEPFVDLRAHILDDAKFASNAGLGVRALAASRLWGANLYWDYRNTSHLHYNQVGVGFETLGKIWDARLNGYFPVGKKKTPLRDTKFDHFKGHFAILRSTYNFALKEISGELGAHVDRFKAVPLYFALGPYYLNGKGATAWGGEVRARAQFLHRHIHLEASVSYDHYFRWIGQGQLSFHLPFGPRKKTTLDSILANRFVQQVDRQEIIPVGKAHRHTKAIDPLTGGPQFFSFVNNMSHSLGTFESPYPTLALAQANSGPGQIIYVFPGDLSSTNMDTGIVLQDGQQLLGASVPHRLATTLGKVTLPPQANGAVSITNLANGPVVTLANNNTVSGFYIENLNGVGISGTNINNFSSSYNTLIGGNLGEAVLLTNVTGKMSFQGNTYVQATNTLPTNYAVHFVQNQAQCSASFTNETFFCASNGAALFADLSQVGSMTRLSCQSCNFVNTGGSNSISDAIEASLQDASFLNNISVFNTSMQNWVNGIEVDVLGSGSIQNIEVFKTAINCNNNVD